MKITTWMMVTALTVGVQTSTATPAQAEGRDREVRSLTREYRNLNREASRLLKRFNRLSTTQKGSALVELERRYDDADGDGVPDLLDDGAGRCNADRDDDGVDDGDEYGNGSSPGDDDSDDDGFSDGLELEVHAHIASIDELSLSLGDSTFGLNSGTVYLDKRNRPLTRADFEVGECVEVEGHFVGGDLVAEKVKVDDDC